MTSLSIRGLSKRYAETPAVQDITLEIVAGEFFSFLGPSGCGKTTLLRTIAGFETPSAGTILLDGRDVTHVPPQERRIGMVFQNYALFPHMTVAQNVAFGLETMRLPRAEVRTRVAAVLEAVQLCDKMHVPVPMLSGGEQQRVAVARALVVEPAVLLFDEPLSNLDVALRVQTREEIRGLQRKTGITTLYVTHDQSEAMSLSDRMAVMRAGRIEQVGTPVEIYESPRTPFVARFLGGANTLPGTYTPSTRQLTLGNFSWVLPPDVQVPATYQVIVAVKPEAVTLHAAAAGGMPTGVIEGEEYLGFTTNYLLRGGGIALRATALSEGREKEITAGREIGFTIDWSRCSFFPGREA